MHPRLLMRASPDGQPDLLWSLPVKVRNSVIAPFSNLSPSSSLRRPAPIESPG
jgi:hypothetical protein